MRNRQTYVLSQLIIPSRYSAAIIKITYSPKAGLNGNTTLLLHHWNTANQSGLCLLRDKPTCLRQRSGKKSLVSDIIILTPVAVTQVVQEVLETSFI